MVRVVVRQLCHDRLPSDPALLPHEPPGRRCQYRRHWPFRIGSADADESGQRGNSQRLVRQQAALELAKPVLRSLRCSMSRFHWLHRQ